MKAGAQWWRSRTGDKPGQEPWRASGRLQWKPVPSLNYWESWGPEWRSFDGAMWARKHVTLRARQAAQAATLSTSAIDDVDETFVNGTAVGGENAYNDPRNMRSPRESSTRATIRSWSTFAILAALAGSPDRKTRSS